MRGSRLQIAAVGHALNQGNTKHGDSEAWLGSSALEELFNVYLKSVLVFGIFSHECKCFVAG